MSVLSVRITKELKKHQSRRRYEHALSVAALAADLGRRHGWDQRRAKLAGLLHDWAKEWHPDELKAYVKKYKVKIPYMKMIVDANPNNLHAYVGADVARRKGWLKNGDDISAIASHTFGSAKMTLAQKILYVADFASPDRTYRKAKTVRNLALKNIEKAFRTALAFKIKHQIRKKRFVHPIALEMWNNGLK